jgi:MHS family shikimate/dehydroshikimate transporter-like MFS transporter
VRETLGRSGSSITPTQVAVASMVGTVMEWYDFFLYVFVAALVFAPLFFPAYSNWAGTLASFATLAVGYLSRPLGGLLCGHLGDRIGRKHMLIATLSLMGASTFVIGLLPTYQTIGLWAPALLTICRFLQGVALGGEWGGAVLVAVEFAPSDRRGYFGSIVQTGATIGLALATTVLFAASYLLSKESFLAWGWRVPFLVSILMLVPGLYIRLKVTETPAFKKVQQEGAISRLPMRDVLKKHPKTVLCTALIYLASINVPFYIVWAFLLYYATAVLKVDRSMLLLGVVVINLVLSYVIIVAGKVSDSVGRQIPFVLGFLSLCALAWPFFWMVDTKSIAWIWGAMFLAATAFWFMWGAMPAYFAEVFPPQLRYTGISLGSQTATIVGGFVPLLATALQPKYGTWAISTLLLVAELLGLVGLITLRNIIARDEPEITPQPARMPAL